MYLPPAEILNQVAKTVKLKHRAVRKLFEMTQPDLDKFLAEQAAVLEAAGHDPKVIVAYQTLDPLLAENEAISQYLEKTGDSTLRMALPELVSKEEAVAIADRELMLTQQQRKALYQLLH